MNCINQDTLIFKYYKNNNNNSVRLTQKRGLIGSHKWVTGLCCTGSGESRGSKMLTGIFLSILWLCFPLCLFSSPIGKMACSSSRIYSSIWEPQVIDRFFPPIVSIESSYWVSLIQLWWDSINQNVCCSYWNCNHFIDF